VSACDAVFDTVGGDVALKSFAALKPGGRAAFIASGASAPAAPAGVRAYRPQVGRDRRHLERLGALVQSGAVRPPELKRFPLAQVAEAHRISEGRHFRGKLVLEVRPG
jgi:NADPH:quinone reductase-like Zn-dependent oxidoreductase